MILSRETRALQVGERAELLKTLRAVGPDAPTLCEEWSARDVAAHIVTAEQNAGVPLALSYPIWRVIGARPGGAFVSRAQSMGYGWMAKATARGWEWLLARLESGPPRPHGVRMIAELRLVEEFVHHEDVRRGNGLRPRTLDREFGEGLIRGMLTIRRFDVFAASRHGIEVEFPDGRRYSVGDGAREGAPRALVKGDVGEVTLWLAGRGTAAEVEVDGEIPETALRV